jgi:hypothetical protein
VDGRAGDFWQKFDADAHKTLVLLAAFGRDNLRITSYPSIALEAFSSVLETIA